MRRLKPWHKNTAKGFYYACDDIQADERYIVYPGTETYPMAHNTKAISLAKILHLLQPST